MSFSSPEHNIPNLPVKDLRFAHSGKIFRLLSRSFRWFVSKNKERRDARRLRVVETLQLGEKRFVTLLEVDGAQYLIGGSASSVALLTHLPKSPESVEAEVPPATQSAESFEDVFQAESEKAAEIVFPEPLLRSRRTKPDLIENVMVLDQDVKSFSSLEEKHEMSVISSERVEAAVDISDEKSALVRPYEFESSRVEVMV